MEELFKCKMCGELIQCPREVEIENNVCMSCLEELAEDVDEGSVMTNEFQFENLINEEMDLNGI